MTPFDEVLADIAALHGKKNADYGTDTDPYANVRASEDFGIPPWVGAAVRANDKMRRLMRFADKDVLLNESVEDSFMDLATYAVLGLLLYREGAGKGSVGRAPVPAPLELNTQDSPRCC